MKKISKILFFACIALVTNYSHAQMSETETDQNIDYNGGFEFSKNNKPVNWLLYTAKTTKSGDFDILLDTGEYKAGNQSLHFNVRECSDKGGRFSPGFTQEIEAKPRDRYKISYWVKNSNTDFVIKISGVSAFKKDSGPINRSNQSYSDWKKFEHEYTIANKMNRLRFELNILKPGEFWIDDIQINKVN